MKTKKTEIEVHFKFDNIDDPDAITKQLGIRPSHRFEKGETLKGTTLKCKTSGWWLTSKSTKNMSFEWHAKRIISVLQSKSAFKTLSKRHKTRISFVAYIYGSDPIYAISASTIKKLARIGSSLDFDIYNFRDPNQSYD